MNSSRKDTAGSMIDSRRELRCPLLQNPGEDCYVCRLTSRNIDSVIRFCLDRFEDCPIFRKRAKGDFGGMEPH